MNGGVDGPERDEGLTEGLSADDAGAEASIERSEADPHVTEADPQDDVAPTLADDGDASSRPDDGEDGVFLGHTIAGPWKRFFARQLDYVVPSLVALVLAFSVDSTPILWLTALGVIPVLLWIIPEAALLAYLGNTPGKWLMGIGLATSDGSRPLLDYTLRRSVSVVIKGMAVNVPIATLIAHLMSYQALKNRKITSWDAASGFQVVERRRVGALQVSALLVVASVAMFAGSWMVTPSAFGSGVARARAQADRKMDSLREWATLTMTDAGVEMKLVGEPIAPLIAAGTTVSHTLALKEGEGRLALATCDEECIDLDLTVLGPDGTIMAEDFEPDAEPAVLFVAPFAGDFTVELSMHSCITENCLAVLELHNIAGYSFERGGSCFVVSEQGDALTAKHVIEGASAITVTLGDGRIKLAELTEALPDDDVALVHMDARTPAFLRISKARPRLGDPVMTLGFPATDILGSDAKYSEGTIASLNGPGGDPDLFQMSAPIQPGSSGGPVLDRDGAVIGLVTSTAADIAFYEQTGSLPQGVNWATKATRFRDLVPGVQPRTASPRPSDRSNVVEKSRRAVCRIEALIVAREPQASTATSTLPPR